MQWVSVYVLNSLWQMPVLALCAWGLVRMTARAGARLHYRLWVGCLLLCVLLPALPAVGRMPSLDFLHWHKAAADARVTQGASAAAAAGPSAAEQIAVYTDQIVSPERTNWKGRAVLWVYAVTLLLGGVKLLRELAATSGVVRRARRMELPPVLAGEMERAAGALGIAPVEVRESGEIRSPATASWPRALLLVPEGFAKVSEEDAAAAIGHELVHVRRKDFETNLAWETLSLVAFYHPAMHWVKRRVVEAREVVCDEMAAGLARDRVAYARSLVSLAENAVNSEQ